MDVINHYHVYVFDMPMTALEHKHIVRRFGEEKEKMEGSMVPFRKNYDENDDCRFETLDEISHKTNLWPMIRTHVIGNPEFHQAVASQSKTPFNLKS